jgi:TolB protein
MLVRAYRLTDKCGVIALKGSLALIDLTLDGLGVVWRQIAFVLLAVARVVWMVLRPFAFILASILVFIFNIFLRATGQTAISVRRSGSNAMARRAARAELDVVLAEDPLRAQNRTLSFLTVLLLLSLVFVVLWATNPARTFTSAAVPLDGGAVAGVFADTPQPATGVPSVLSTSVPTATPLPSVLEVRGSLAYVVRESAQTDIWAIPIGGVRALRITNSPEDERDPAWSPDGRRLAYASRQDGNWEVYIYDVVNDTTQRMTFDLSYQGNPSWSNDGEWLVYESYQGSNLDVYLMRVDGSETIRLPGNAPAPDFSPAWSPEGRRIAFVSWREGNQDIYLFSLDNQTVTNVTNTPTRQEDHPAWSPDGDFLAFSALDEGLEKVFIVSTRDPNATPTVVARGRTPAWSPDGASLVFALDTIDGTQLIANPIAGTGVVTSIIPAPLGSSSPVWTGAPLPVALVNGGGLPASVTQALYIEQVETLLTDPPVRLSPIEGVQVDDPLLSDRVNDSFNALREASLGRAGWDFLGRLDDAFWSIDRPPQPGEERRNWLMTGRAFGITRGAIISFPPSIEVVREDVGVNTVWRVYLRAAGDAQSGEFGEPLRHMPWDFASRTEGDIEAYNQGGRLKRQFPEGYYIDFTQLAQDYGWLRYPAGSDWRANANSINYWLFTRPDGLTWYQAMRELYTDAQLGGFAPTATPAFDPTPTAGG